jgi:protein kinase A
MSSNQLAAQVPIDLKQLSFVKRDSRSRSNTARTSKLSSRSQKISVGEVDKKQSYLNYLMMHELATAPRRTQALKPLTKGSFQFQVVIGKGGFGRVWRVLFKRNRKLLALKEMSKALIISKRNVPSVMNEKNLLMHLAHPFIVNMQFSFQDRENLYLAMDLLTAGDLRTQLGRVRVFSE